MTEQQSISPDIASSVAESLAAKFENGQPSWLPIAGHVRNITFTLQEAELIASIIRRAAALAVVSAPWRSPVATPLVRSLRQTARALIWNRNSRSALFVPIPQSPASC